jgi:hypothetical protein
MATEQYANNATTVLSGAINSGASSLVVTSADLFPTSPQFRIRIDSELLLVTAVAGTTFTVTRGVEGTTAAAHSEGAVVRHVLTRDGLKGIGGSTVLTGAFQNRPVAGTDGRLFLASGGYQIDRDNGTDWRSWGPTHALTPPVDGDFAWVNQEDASVETTQGGIYLLAPAIVSADLRIRKKAAPATPYTITAAFIPHMAADAAYFPGLGLLFRESGTGKLITWSYTLATTVFARPQKWNSPTSFNSAYIPLWDGLSEYQAAALVWFRIADTGSNLTFSFSNDGRHFYQTFSVSRTDFMSGGPDEVGFWANATTNYDTGMLLLSWQES